MKRFALLLSIVALIAVSAAVFAGAGGASTAENEAYVLAFSDILTVETLAAPEGSGSPAIEFYTLPVGGSIALTAKADGVHQQISYYDASNKKLGAFAMGDSGTSIKEAAALAKGATVSHTLADSDTERAFFSVDVSIDGAVTSYYFAVETPQPLPAEGSLRPALPVTAPASPTAATVVFDGIPIPLQAYTIDGFTYFKLRDIAFVLSGTGKQFEVAWDGERNQVLLTTGASYTPAGGEAQVPALLQNETARSTASTILLDGAETSFTAFLIGGNNYFKLRDLAAALNFGVAWDATAGVITVDSTQGYSE